MMSAVRITCMTALAASVVWVASGRDQQNAKVTPPGQQDEQGQLQASDHDEIEVAARYHLRGRTKRFFQRAGGRPVRKPSSRASRFLSADETPTDQIASRYHYRGRTKRFFKRAAC